MYIAYWKEWLNFDKELCMASNTRRSGCDRRRDRIQIGNDEDRRYEDRRALLREPAQIIETMKKIPMFMGLADEHYEKILSICSKKLIPGDQYLCRGGEPSNALYILAKGQLEVMTKNGVFLAYITMFGSVGEMGVFTDTPRSASVVATEDCVVLSVHKAELFRLFESDCALGNRVLLNVVKDLANKIQEDNEIIDELRKRRSSIL